MSDLPDRDGPDADLDAAVASPERDVAAVTNHDIPLLKGKLRRLMGFEVGSIDELLEAGRDIQRRLSAVEERLSVIEGRLDRLGDVGAEATTKAEKFATVLSFAMNKRNGSAMVAVSPHEVKGCTGVSRRYAYELINAVGATVDGVKVREARTVPTGSGPNRKGEALLVDCEQVQVSDGSVNGFTTGGASTGGS